MARLGVIALVLAMAGTLFNLPHAHRAAAQQQPAEAEDGEVLTDPRDMARIEAAVDRALEYLTQTQKPDGSWPSGFGDNGSNNGVNAVCLLAFLGRGHAPNRGPYQEVVNRAVTSLLATQEENGLLSSPAKSHGVMYEHALATLALIEAYGFVPSIEMRKNVQKAVDVIVGAQNGQGGWRYNPHPGDADLSVTVMQVVALRAALNARLNVPDKTMTKALEYVRSCAHGGGGFSYQPGGGPNMAQSAAGALCMQLLGEFDDPAVTKALDLLLKHNYHPNEENYFYYMTYYSMQAHFQKSGDYWARWYPKVQKFLLNTQQENGSWPGYHERQINGNKADCYSTAMGAMSLEVFMHYLPAYQR